MAVFISGKRICAITIIKIIIVIITEIVRTQEEFRGKMSSQPI